MDSQRIQAYLQALGEELERRGFLQAMRIMIVGGTYMLFRRDAQRDTTQGMG